jgi:uncharacterized cupredoxin-like copper-binding protein
MIIKTLIAALSSALMASAALASGTHAGGHHGEAASAIGQPGKASQVTRTVTVDMNDNMRFTPSQISAKKGETIKFIVKNSGQIKHEMVFGTEQELKEHYEVMKKFPDMEHEDANQINVLPGQTGELIWKFTQSGPVNFACLHVGHYEAGMVGIVNVAGKPAPKK